MLLLKYKSLFKTIYQGSQWNVTQLYRKSGVKKNAVVDLIIITGVREAKPRLLDIARE